MAEKLGLPPVGAGSALERLLGPLPEQSELSASDLRRWTLQALSVWIRSLASLRPLLLLVEDFHWADPSTSSLLREFVDQIATLPILMIVTCRSNFHADWPVATHVRQVLLGRLSPDDCLDLAAAILPELDPAVVRAISDRSDGVPLFVEEFASAALSCGETGQDLPGTVAQLLVSRLDAVGAARDLAHTIAVIGRDATMPTLEAVAGLPADELSSQIDRLVESGILARRGYGVASVVSFRHALLADAAYQALPSAPRRQLHGFLAERLCAFDPIMETSQPEVLARHWEQAGDAMKAAGLFRRAALNMLAAAAYAEAEVHARRALRLGKSATGSDRSRQMLAALELVGQALIATQGYASHDVHATFEQATKIALQIGETKDILPVLRGLTSFYQVRGPVSRAWQIGERMLELAEFHGDAMEAAGAERRLGWCKLCQGHLDEARALLESGLRKHFCQAPTEIALRPETGIIGLGNLAWLSWMQDGDRPAIAMAKRAAEHAERAGISLASAYGLGFAAAVNQMVGNVTDTRRLAAKAGEMAAARGIVYWTAMSEALLGWATAAAGRLPQGLTQLRVGIESYRRLEARILGPYLLILLAETERRAGAHGAALLALDEATEVSLQIGANMFLPIVGWRRGQVLADLGHEDTEQTLCSAIDLAEQQVATALTRRIRATLAGLGDQSAGHVIAPSMKA